ncbi:MAG TPA: hypothetical protein VF605_10685 [Allosphingosinicella sp.]|jgi:hypothetical protein
MTARLRWELRGRGWTLSLQRSRPAAETGRSANLGAAPLAIEGSGRAATRVGEGERLWVAVSAPPGVPVAARLAHGEALEGEVMEGAGGGPALHRLQRVHGEAAGGLEAGPGAGGDGLTVTIGERQVEIRLLAADEFDRRFGPVPAVEGEPAVYEGWRLP